MLAIIIDIVLDLFILSQKPVVKLSLWYFFELFFTILLAPNVFILT